MSGVPRSRKAVIVLAALAAASCCLIVGTAVNYMGAARAASGFSASISEISLEGSADRPAVRVMLAFGNDSSWRLEALEAHVSVFFGEEYVWGRSFDWLGDPIVLGPGDEKTVPLDVHLPPQKLPAGAEGGTWTARVSGLIDMPMLGRKAFRCYGSTSASGANGVK
ncbi:MAG: hypothetical protein AB1563_12725 [Bacillota bacterium]|nr:hypothetical protein [Bacillota bacterium]